MFALAGTAIVRKVPDLVLRIAVLLWLGPLSPAVRADTAAGPPTTTSSAALPTASDTDAYLQELQGQQDQIKRRASTANSDAQLIELDAASQQLADNVNGLLITALRPERAKLQTELEVLGPEPAPGVSAETPDIAQQRLALSAHRSKLDAEIRQAEGIKENLVNLAGQLARLQHDHLKNQFAFRSGSILSAQFWSPLFDPEPADRERLRSFNAQIAAQLQPAWQPDQRLATTLILLLALAVWTVGARLLERAQLWFCLHRLPEGRLRRSTMALCATLASVLSTTWAIQLIYFALTRQQSLTPSLQEFAGELAKLALTCAMIEGLGHGLLSTRRPSWRLPVMADAVALAIGPFPRILALLLMLSGTVEQINRSVDTSLQMTLFGRGVVSLVVVVTIGASLLRANRARSALAAAGNAPEARSTLAGLIHAGITLAVVAALFALLSGYISAARFVTYELVWFDLVLCSFYLLTKLTRDACESFLSARHASGKTIKHLFGVTDVHLEQVSTVLSGIGNSVLLIVTAIALLTGGFGTTPSDLFNTILDLFGGDSLRRLAIVPAHMPNAILTLVLGLYLLRSMRSWLDKEFLPKTGMGPGMSASVLALFVNIGYVLIALLTLVVLGVRWDSLAWIVSALSVGIGFGLQEIVKNFVSGLILLTERPVKVGDIVSIGGIEGDIRRINVRATEIQLADRSTVIVPNSHLISQNLRNVTMGNNTQGVVTVTLTFPLDVDPELVRDLLLDACRSHPSILEHPVPSVMFSQLTSDGITLSASGYVHSPRITADTKSDLLFDILKRLRATGIPLSTPQTITIRELPENFAGSLVLPPERKQSAEV